MEKGNNVKRGEGRYSLLGRKSQGDSRFMSYQSPILCDRAFSSASLSCLCTNRGVDARGFLNRGVGVITAAPVVDH